MKVTGPSGATPSLVDQETTFEPPAAALPAAKVFGDGFDGTVSRQTASLIGAPVSLEAAALTDPAVFDARYYLDHNPDLGAAGIATEEGARQHWVQYGVSEGRAGRADFDPKAHLSRYGDLTAAYGQDTRKATQHYLTYGLSEGRNGAPEGVSGPTIPQTPVVEDSALSLKNTNLRLLGPHDENLGTLGGGPSDWGVKQWHTSDVLTPSSGGRRTDPELGVAQRSLVSASSALAIYDDPTRPGNPAYELATAGGQNSNYGAQNLFLQKELNPPAEVGPGAVIELDYKIAYASIQKTADFDAKNLAQVHLGMLLRNEKTGETLFLQREMFESNNTGLVTHVDGNHNDPNDRGRTWASTAPRCGRAKTCATRPMAGSTRAST